ncbi:MAG TPA: hypothetical protein VF590_05385, partial [Isosphaeraceae bacterium]
MLAVGIDGIGTDADIQPGDKGGIGRDVALDTVQVIGPTGSRTILSLHAGLELGPLDLQRLSGIVLLIFPVLEGHRLLQRIGLQEPEHPMNRTDLEHRLT